MKICISETKFNPTFLTQPQTNEEMAINQFGYQIVEIPNECSNCAREDFDLVNGVYVFNQTKYNERIAQRALEKQNNIDYIK